MSSQFLPRSHIYIHMYINIFQLGHLKRIRKCMIEEKSKPKEGTTDEKTCTTVLELIICPSETTIPRDISALLPVTRLVNVCKYPPRSRQDAQEWGQLWPVQFKPNENDRIRDRGLSEHEMLQVDHGRKELQRVISMHRLQNCTTVESVQTSAALIMNPENSTVLIDSKQAREYVDKSLTPSSSSSSSSPCFSELNPLYTTGMILIEGISAMVRGEEVISVEDNALNTDSDNIAMCAVPTDQYLLTGLDVYLQQEPDLMTAMAFLHSRVRRIYYLETDEVNGALGSKYVLNDMAKLNHRFRVFHLTTT